MTIRIAQGHSSKRDFKTIHPPRHTTLDKEIEAYMALLPYLLPENEGRYGVFYQGNPLGFWDKIDGIDYDYVRKVVGRYANRAIIHQVTKLDLKHGFGGGRRAQIRRVPESDRIYQGNTLH